MKGFTHVYNELKDQGLNPKKIGEFEQVNPHGRRFYSDGRYKEAIYDVDENSDYQIGVKTTGRVEIRLYKKGLEDAVQFAVSQKEFIEVLKEEGILESKEEQEG